ncbi:DNA-directed RNA polymerase I subunit RPA49 [Chionoecetes opilio]|uniref:DNA-directed RNA polymerase I subunit RPA49 n=1 Tax=Chionoecetes opilio TaxID=41210 RepID=A0A8J4XSM7_CHIOP|nr:DNA-directed RNA polymerase I subunit RPA49 [Chionoecetes opilio]
MRLIETSQYTVQPVLKDTAFHNASKGPDEVNTYDEKQEAIAASFGSKKAKQAVARRRQNRVETDTMSGAIDQAAAAAGDQALGVEEFMEQQEGTSLITILPPVTGSCRSRLKHSWGARTQDPHLIYFMKVIGANYSTSSHSYVLKLPLAKYSQNFKKSKKPKKR